MTRREGADGWVAPVTQLFGAPARPASTPAAPSPTPRATPPVERTDEEGWYVPTGDEESDGPSNPAPVVSPAVSPASVSEAAPAHASAVAPRRLPTYADFDRSSRSQVSADTAVVDAADRFARRRSGPLESKVDDASAVGTAEHDESDGERGLPRRRIENVSTAALARRGLSEAEVRSRLTEKGFTAEQVEPEIQRLLDAGYLDDRRLAEEVVRIEAERKGKGRSAIVAELRRRGIDADDFEEALSALDADDELDRARDLVLKKISSLRNVDDETAKRRLYGALSRRGFGGDVVRTAVAEGMIDRP